MITNRNCESRRSHMKRRRSIQNWWWTRTKLYKLIKEKTQTSLKKMRQAFNQPKFEINAYPNDDPSTWNKLISTESVSYTHLDVYKRQIFTFNRTVFEHQLSPIHWKYTLLDDVREEAQQRDTRDNRIPKRPRRPVWQK